MVHDLQGQNAQLQEALAILREGEAFVLVNLYAT